MGGISNLTDRGHIDWRSLLSAAPFGIVIGDPTGRVLFANPAAVARRDGEDHGTLLGEGVAAFLPGGASRVPDAIGARGERAWFLGSQDRFRDELEQARFAIEVADSLAGTLNLTRTLTRVVHLAAPTLGRWATVAIINGTGLRVVHRGPNRETSDRRVDATALSSSGLAPLEEAMRAGRSEYMITDAAELEGLGCSSPLARELVREGAVAVDIAPLRAHGVLLGALVVAVDPDGRFQHQAIAALARRAAIAIGAAKVYDERSALAETLRASLLPAPVPATPGIRIGAAYRPAEVAAQIGGDFYDVQRDGSGWSLSLGDVCGKGIEAAVLTGQVRQSLRTVIPLAKDPAERLRLLNAALFESDGRSYVTVLLASLHRRDDEVAVRIACGGHPPPLLRTKAGEIRELRATGTLIGMMPAVDFAPAELALQEGETLVSYTDGLTDARGPNDRFGLGRIARILKDCGDMGPQAIADRLVQHSLDHARGSQGDDVAVVAIQPERSA